MGIIMKNGIPYAHGSEIPQGGIKGQVLAKASDLDGDFEWTAHSSGDQIQVAILPTSSATEEGKIYQYIGITDTNYTNGYFYECVEITPSTDPKTYKWEAKSVQAGGSSVGAFVLDTANPCSYNELQSAIDAPKVILIKHDGFAYPFVEKWESDEGAKRYVNIASIQRQGVDKGAMYFFFEATMGDLDSQMAYSSNFSQPTGKPYTDSVVGDLTDLTTTTQTDVVSAINELKFNVDALGEPFRVKQWGASNLNVTIVPCTSDTANTSLEKITFKITDQEAADYQIVGMIAYELFDAASGGNRINCWPVCQFTGNGQTELSVRWMCGGTTNKVAKRINAFVLLKHR